MKLKRIFEGFANRKQPHLATVRPSGETIEIPRNKTLLQAALGHGVVFPHHCTVGTCGNCRCKLLAGDIRAVLDFSYTLSGEEIKEGYILACQTMLKSDIEIELEVAEEAFESESYRGVVTQTRNLTHDIIEISVELDHPIKFLAGQFADIALPEYDRHRSYSFATCPMLGGTKKVQFQVRLVPGGGFTEWLFAEDRTNTTFELHGPSGNFWLRKSQAPILCVAGGSGMAPIKAILEDAANSHINRRVTYLYGAREQRDLYCLEEMATLKEKWPGQFNFLPILSEQNSDSGWQGKCGLVTDFINDETVGFPLTDAHVYLCGPPGMIDAALNTLANIGVKPGQIHYDKFLDARQLESSQ